MNLAHQIIMVKAVSDLQEKKDALQVRRTVFVEEQKVPVELEIDQYDEHPEAIHFVAYNQDQQPVGAARLREYTNSQVGKVERVAVLKNYRGNGNGQKLMEHLEKEAIKKGFVTLKLNAQLHAQSFYTKMGYLPYGEVFMDAGIEHISMKKSLL